MRAALAWGLAFLGGGTAIAFGLLPGAARWASAPRAGIAALLLMLGFLVLALATVGAFLRRTARPGDYAGGCPVGATCRCGHFNFKPRHACRACGQPTQFSDA